MLSPESISVLVKMAALDTQVHEMVSALLRQEMRQGTQPSSGDKVSRLTTNLVGVVSTLETNLGVKLPDPILARIRNMTVAEFEFAFVRALIHNRENAWLNPGAQKQRLAHINSIISRS